ncbi:MAG: tetratricopeptide repeat protein [Planctomycetota bacterium]|nr:tetratricopeptide repeat protein [Planctomycetota bacterium]
MRKSVTYLIAGIGAAAVPLAAFLLITFHKAEPRVEGILTLYRDDAEYAELKIRYPLDGTLFPPEIVPPTFRWEDNNSACDTWLVTVAFEDDEAGMNFLTREPHWTADPKQWEVIKQRSLEKDAQVAILGVRCGITAKIVSAGLTTIRTSQDEVGAPLFFREVNLPFIDAVKDPSRIRWRFGAVSSPQQPPVVLENLPVCGNCHSFCKAGKTLAMDVDYANSKGSYVITPVAEQMQLATSNIITWDNFAKEEGEQTFGLLSQISPDGKFVVSTVRDKSVFVPMPDLAFSQLFFPIKGILCIYDRSKQTFQALPGADNPEYVQSNPVWSPDGRYIVFARAKAYDLEHTRGKGKVLLTREECKEFTENGKPFLFDLYRIPFNDGKGGAPEPLEGASNNGMSNFFAKFSPDGKWIVFCKARSYMLLQHDSELYIIPAQGGKAARLRANTSRMNSWHSFSPNSRWLVFSSKANSAYTQLFLTHIDEKGRSSPAVLLEHFTASDRAANIPEFVNVKPAAIKNIREQFLNDYSFVRAGNEFFKAGDAENAIQEYCNALELNPRNVEAHRKLGFLFYNVKRNSKEAMSHYNQAIKLDPNDPRIHHDLGMALLHQRQYDRAIGHLSEALRRMPDGSGLQYKPANMHYNLGRALLLKGNPKDSVAHLAEAVRLDPDKSPAHYNLALALADQGNLEKSLEHYTTAVRLRPEIDTSPTLHHLLAMNYAQARRFREAVLSSRKALDLANTAGDQKLKQEIEKWLEVYKQMDGSSN